jgi:hypothetical protein
VAPLCCSLQAGAVEPSDVWLQLQVACDRMDAAVVEVAAAYGVKI